MKLSDDTLEWLVKVIANNLRNEYFHSRQVTNIEILEALMEFFLDIKEGGHLDVLSETRPVEYGYEILKKHNGTDFIKKAVEKVLLPKLIYNDIVGCSYDARSEIELAGKFVTRLDKDGYKLVAVKKVIEGSDFSGIYYSVLNKKEFVEHTPEIEKNTTAKNKKEEAEKNFTEGNYTATLTDCFTLVETVIKNMLDELKVDYNEDVPFVDVYPKLSKALKLKPAEDNIEGRLEPILEGLIKQIDGLKDQVKGVNRLANKSSGRHRLKFLPKRQDAKLGMNASFTLCEYLLDAQKNLIAEQELATS